MAEPADAPVLQTAADLTQEFEVRSVRTKQGGSHGRERSSRIFALRHVSIDVQRGERLGIVGESGSGKTTLGKALAGLRKPDSGSVLFDSVDIYKLRPPELRKLRSRLQIVLQDPASSLDRRMKVFDILAEGLRTHLTISDDEILARVESIAALTNINLGLLQRKPAALSGGQRQRVAVARSIILEPELVILDEPVSALDVSVQAQLLNVLLDLQEEKRLTYVFIVHDLAVAEWFCDRIAVMYGGEIVEQAKGVQLFDEPLHPYTRELLAAVPGRGRHSRLASRVLPESTGEEPDAGCPFRVRCPVGHDRARCRDEKPLLRSHESGPLVACHYPGAAAEERVGIPVVNGGAVAHGDHRP